MHVGNACTRLEQVEEEGRRDVVGQVAADAEWRPSAVYGRKIHLEHVALVHDELPSARATLAQHGDQVAVDLDRLEAMAALEQRPRQGTAAGPDLDDALARPRIDGRDNAREYARVVQEMLAETLARANHPRRCARSIASNRLPGSARPVPARSSAVP